MLSSYGRSGYPHSLCLLLPISWLSDSSSWPQRMSAVGTTPSQHYTCANAHSTMYVGARIIMIIMTQVFLLARSKRCLAQHAHNPRKQCQHACVHMHSSKCNWFQVPAGSMRKAIIKRRKSEKWHIGPCAQQKSPIPSKKSDCVCTYRTHKHIQPPPSESAGPPKDCVLPTEGGVQPATCSLLPVKLQVYVTTACVRQPHACTACVCARKTSESI